MEAYIYVIKCGGFVKIGKTNAPHTRIKSIQGNTPYKIRMLYCELHQKGKEKELHERFSHLHYCGEWFRHTKEIDRYFNIDGISEISIKHLKPLKRYWAKHLTNEQIEKTFKRCNNDVRLAASALGISWRTLYRRLGQIESIILKSTHKNKKPYT